MKKMGNVSLKFAYQKNDNENDAYEKLVLFENNEKYSLIDLY